MMNARAFRQADKFMLWRLTSLNVGSHGSLDLPLKSLTPPRAIKYFRSFNLLKIYSQMMLKILLHKCYCGKKCVVLLGFISNVFRMCIKCLDFYE